MQVKDIDTCAGYAKNEVVILQENDSKDDE